MAFNRIVLSSQNSTNMINTSDDPSLGFQQIILDRKCKFFLIFKN